MRWWRLAAAAGIVGLVPVLAATAAAASLTGSCGGVEARGTLEGVTYDPRTVDEVEIPAEGDVAWTGSVPDKGDEGRPIKGHVKVKLPPPIGSVSIGSWDEESSTYSNADTYHYDLPSALKGIDIPVTGAHTEPGIDCSGAVTVRLAGTSPAAIPALVLTALSAATLVVAIRGGA